MAKTKFDEMMDRLPSSIKETEVLRYQTKKVLAALLELLLHSEARQSRIIYCQNSRLSKLAGVDSNKLLPSIQQLIDYDLITRKVGTGEGIASEYVINIKKLKEPLVEKSFDDLFSEFLIDNESSEKPINTTIPTTITTSITNTTSTITPISNTSSTLNTTLTTSQVQEQSQKKVERPSNYSELMTYFVRRMEKECNNKNLDELNEIQESLKDELDEFNEIRGYKNIYNYLIKPSMEKKKEKLLVKMLEDGETSNKTKSQSELMESLASAPLEDISQLRDKKTKSLPDEMELSDYLAAMHN